MHFTEHKEHIPDDGESSNSQNLVTEDLEPSQQHKRKCGSLNEVLPLNKKLLADTVLPSEAAATYRPTLATKKDIRTEANSTEPTELGPETAISRTTTATQLPVPRQLLKVPITTVTLIPSQLNQVKVQVSRHAHY